MILSIHYTLMSLFLVAVSIFSLNIGIVLFCLPLYLYCLFAPRNTNSYVFLLLMTLIFFFPNGVNISTSLLLPASFISFFLIAVLLINFVTTFKIPNIFAIKDSESILIKLILITAFFVYIPIPLASIFGIHISGPEENYISNYRNSLSITFLLPLISALLVLPVVKSCINKKTDLQKIFILNRRIFFYILALSFLSYILKIDFIPQSYLEIGSLDNRMAGLMDADPNGFARSLIFGYSLFLIFFLNKKNDFLTLFILIFIVIAIFLSGSRTFFIGMMIATTYSLVANKPTKFKTFFIPFAAIIFLYLNFSIFSNRGIALDPATLSGRPVYWLAILSILSVSPFVGLRPGGYIKYLEEGVMFWGTQLKVQSAHSMYFEVAINWGIPLLLFMLLAIVITFFKNQKIITLTYKNKSFQAMRNWLIAINATLAAYVVCGLAEIIPLFVIFFLMATSIAIRSKLFQ